MEKIEMEEEEKEQEQEEGQNLMMEWQCEACTMYNQMGNTHC